MTRADYVLIAVALRVRYHLAMLSSEHGQLTNRNDDPRMSMVHDIATDLAGILYQDNPRFDTDHFLAVVRGERDLNSRPGRR